MKPLPEVKDSTLRIDRVRRPRLRLFAVLAAALAAGMGAACAQVSGDVPVRAAMLAPDLQLPGQPASIAAAGAPEMALYKPEGDGPFPAVVLLHQCGGLRSGNGVWTNQSMLGWAREAVSRGYVALLLDSLGPRSVDTVCMGPKGGVTFARGVRDAFQAADHLAKLPYVDHRRVAFAGFSWGAMVGLLGGSAAWEKALAPGARFRAVAAVYPGCFDIRPPGLAAYPIVNADIGVPMLVLAGGRDTETPAAECVSRLEAIKAAGGPVEWHVYADATHCWDCANLDGFRKTDWRGNAVEYRYDREVTQDTAARIFEFFARASGGGK